MIFQNAEFIEALPVIEKINQAGFEAYFVGGSVRDAILGDSIHDVDIASNASPEEIKSLFRKTIDVGIEHGTVMVLYLGSSYEITTFRTEATYIDHRRPEAVTFVKSLKEDLLRRDFTINAMAIDGEGQLIDYFGGREDLAKGLVRAVGDADARFNEDALRMMRAIRFVSQLDFELEPITLAAIKHHANLLKYVSVERIEVEFTKLLLGKNWQQGLKFWLETGLILLCPKMTDAAKEQVQLFVESINQPFETALQAWTLFLYYLNIQPSDVSSFMRAWKKSNQQTQQVSQSLKALRFRLENSWTIDSLYEFNETALIVESWLDMFGIPAEVDATKRALCHLPIKNLKDLAINGNQLMTLLNKEKGPWIGHYLKDMEIQVLHGKLANNYDELATYATSKVEP